MTKPPQRILVGQFAAGPVGAGVEIGPLEPFYLTRILTTA